MREQRPVTGDPGRALGRALFASGLLAASVLGIAARARHLSHNLDGDEVFSVLLASSPIREVVVRALQDRAHPPLYSVALHFWIQLFGPGELAVRSLSVFAALLALVALGFILARLTTRGVVVGVLMVAALSPLLVYHGQQARPYALIQLFCTLNLLAFLRMREHPSSACRSLVWACSCGVLVWTQYLGLLFLAPQLVQVGLGRDARRWRSIGLGVLAILTIVPWLLRAFDGAFDGAPGGAPGAAPGAAPGGTRGPVPDVSWIAQPSAVDLAWFFVSIFGVPPGARALPLVAGLVVLFLSAAPRVSRLPTRTVLLVAGLAIVPPVALYLVSAVSPIPLWAERHLLGSAIAFLVLVALCLGIAPRLLAAAALAALVGWTAASVGDADPRNSRPPWRAIAGMVGSGETRVLAEEKWVAEPLWYYAPGSQVVLRPATESATPEDSRVIVVCRPKRCATVDRLGSRYAVSRRISLPWQVVGGVPQQAIEVIWLDRAGEPAKPTKDPAQAPADAR